MLQNVSYFPIFVCFPNYNNYSDPLYHYNKEDCKPLMQLFWGPLDKK